MFSYIDSNGVDIFNARDANTYLDLTKNYILNRVSYIKDTVKPMFHFCSQSLSEPGILFY